MSVYRNMSRYLIPATLLLNVVFAALILADKRPALTNPITPSSTGATTTDSSINFVPATAGDVNHSKPEIVQGLSWEKLKSADIREFVNRLRSAGAPEQVIEYLALAAWDDYVKGETEKTEKPEFWVVSDKAAQIRAERSSFRKRLESEGRLLFKELFGYVPDRDFRKELANQGEILFVLGFIPDPKFERLMSELKYMVESDQRIEAPNELRQQKMAGVYKKALEMAALQLAPSEVEEARLRLSMFAATKMSKELSAMGLSGYQSREVLRALFQSGKDPIEKLLSYDGSGGALIDLDPALIGHIINPPQLLKLQRMADPLLNQAYLFAESQGLPAETAVQLNQITLATKVEMDSIKDKYLLAENRKKAQADTQRITMETFLKIIPPDKMPAFQQQYVQMLRGMMR